jgi:hypothetical protein
VTKIKKWNKLKLTTKSLSKYDSIKVSPRDENGGEDEESFRSDMHSQDKQATLIP